MRRNQDRSRQASAFGFQRRSSGRLLCRAVLLLSCMVLRLTEYLRENYRLFILEVLRPHEILLCLLRPREILRCLLRPREILLCLHQDALQRSFRVLVPIHRSEFLARLLHLLRLESLAMLVCKSSYPLSRPVRQRGGAAAQRGGEVSGRSLRDMSQRLCSPEAPT